jgi:hypothetical protein
MKKRLTYLFLLALIILFFLPYLLIPSDLKVSALSKTARSIDGTFRSLSRPGDWSAWWPEAKVDSTRPCTDFHGCLFRLGSTDYQVTGLYYNALSVTIRKESQSFESRINLISLNGDSTYIHWEYRIQTSWNPIARIRIYREAMREKENMNRLLSHAADFLNVISNVYGHDVKLIMSKDSTLVVMNLKTPAYPGTQDIYRSIGVLRAYAQANQAKENNFPMLMPNKNTPGAFESFVALSIDKALPGKGDILQRRYVPWKDLMLEVRGGDSSIARAKRELEYYILDNHVQVMSRTFESLVTDRSLEKDSAKWITRLVCSIP